MAPHNKIYARGIWAISSPFKKIWTPISSKLIKLGIGTLGDVYR